MSNFVVLKAMRSSHHFVKRFLSSKELTQRPEFLLKLRECYRLEEKQQIVVPQFKRALLHGHNIAVKDSVGEYTYFQLYMQSKRLSRQISNICGSGSGSTIGIFLSNDVLFILNLWACWMSGQVAMPLNCHQDYPSLHKLIIDSNLKMIITTKNQKREGLKIAHSLAITHLSVDHLFMKQQNYPFNMKREIFIADNLVFFEGLLQNNFYTQALAFLLFLGDEKDPNNWHTVPVSYKQLDVQLKAFVQTWSVTSADRLLTIFPTQRLNGSLATALLFALNEGSCLQLVEPFDPTTAWGLLMGINTPVKDRVNVMIAEPQVYQNLIGEYDKIFAKNNRMVEYIRDYCSNKIRLMISCCVKLSTQTYTRWLEITGHSLMESDNVCCHEMVKKLKGDCMKTNNHFDTTNLSSITSSNVKLRIVDSANNILLESNGNSIKKIYTSSLTVVGSLWISSADDVGDGSKESYYSTGDVVMYQDGVFTFVGRSNQQ